MPISAPVFQGVPGLTLKAWVLFSGHSLDFTACVIARSFNIADVTRSNSIGFYNLGFSSALATTTYLVIPRGIVKSPNQGLLLKDISRDVGGAGRYNFAITDSAGTVRDPGAGIWLEFWE